MSARTRLAGAATLVAIGSLLVGCGGSTGSSGSTGSTDDPSSAGTTTEDGLTRPGTSLALGETATVPLDDDAGTIELTVTSITEGDPQDVPNLDGTPYYVRLEATAVSGDADQFFVETYLGAMAGETLVPPIATPLTVGPCERAYFQAGAGAGTALDTCVTYVVEDGGAAIDHVGFQNDDGYRLSDGTAVEWSES